MEPTGIIFAALDCDLDAVEEWNRWYDLEHTPMNVSIDGVMLSRRYVATPDCHAARRTSPSGDSPFAGGRAAFLTTYVLAGDPQLAFDGMSAKLPALYDEGRMTFPAEKKAVREGDVFRGVRATGDPALRLDEADVPFVGHTGVIVVQRRGGSDRAEALVGEEGVHGVWSLVSRSRPELHLDLVFVDGDPAQRADQLRAHDHGGELVLDAPFHLIDPLRYPWADALCDSDLPRTVA